MTFYCRIVIILTFLLALAGCSPNNNLPSNHFDQTQINDNLNYFVVQTEQIPDFISNQTSLSSNLLSIFPQSEYISQFLQNNTTHLKPIFHFYWSSSNSQPTYVLVQPLVNQITLPEQSSLPSNLYFQTKDNFLIISNRQNYFPTVIIPPTKSFLTIYSFDLPLPIPDQVQESDLSTIAIIASLKTIIHTQPINFYFQNNQILIDTTDYQTPQPETKLVLNLANPAFNSSISQQIFIKKTLSLFSSLYLSDKILKLDTVEKLTLKQENTNFALYLQYPTEYDLSSIQNQIKNQLKQQKSYFSQYKTLPDNTSTLIYSPGNQNIDPIFSENNISYTDQNQKTVYLAFQPNSITITNYQLWSNQTTIPSDINIPWSSIKTFFPQLLDQLNFFKSIQLKFTNNSYSGLIVK